MFFLDRNTDAYLLARIVGSVLASSLLGIFLFPVSFLAWYALLVVREFDFGFLLFFLSADGGKNMDSGIYLLLPERALGLDLWVG